MTMTFYATTVRDLVYNPPSLLRLCAHRVRQSISCIGQNVERNLIEKLNARDLPYVRNPNVPIPLNEMCKYFVLHWCIHFYITITNIQFTVANSSCTQDVVVNNKVKLTLTLLVVIY